jgi:hypothetical protein
MTMLNEVNQTIAALTLEDADAAALELARTYARELDGAAAIRARADKAVKEARLRGDDEHTAEVEALRAKLSERAALVQVGKLLHLLLAELNATPKARGGAKRPPSQQNSLQQFRLRAAK